MQMFFWYFLRIFWLMHGVCSLPRPTLDSSSLDYHAHLSSALFIHLIINLSSGRHITPQCLWTPVGLSLGLFIVSPGEDCMWKCVNCGGWIELQKPLDPRVRFCIVMCVDFKKIKEQRKALASKSGSEWLQLYSGSR